jgi:hypothetical protein
MTDTAARKKSQKRQRNLQIKTPCTLDEFNAVAAKADAAGLSRAAYSRTVLLGEPGPRAQRRLPADGKILRQVLALHGKYGSNMNQIAHNLNAGDPCDLPELRRALKEWGEIRDTMLRALGLLPNPAADGLRG